MVRSRGASWTAPVAVALMGCGASHGGSGDLPGSSGISAATLASFEGSYALETYTQNDASCEMEGPSLLAESPDDQFVMVGSDVIEGDLGLAPCGDVGECYSKVQDVRAGRGISGALGRFLDLELGPDRLSGGAVHVTEVGGTCVERYVRETLLTREGQRVRVETRTLTLPDAPPGPNGCNGYPISEWRKQEAGRPCTALTVFSGQKTGPLPE